MHSFRQEPHRLSSCAFPRRDEIGFFMGDRIGRVSYRGLNIAPGLCVEKLREVRPRSRLRSVFVEATPQGLACRESRVCQASFWGPLQCDRLRPLISKPPFQRQDQKSHRRMTMPWACANEKIHGLVSLAKLRHVGQLTLGDSAVPPRTKVQGDLSPIARPYSIDRFA